MDNHERSTLEQILNLLHGLLGRNDAKADYRPELTFVPDNPGLLSRTIRMAFSSFRTTGRKKKKALRLTPWARKMTLSDSTMRRSDKCQQTELLQELSDFADFPLTCVCAPAEKTRSLTNCAFAAADTTSPPADGRRRKQKPALSKRQERQNHGFRGRTVFRLLSTASLVSTLKPSGRNG